MTGFIILNIGMHFSDTPEQYENFNLYLSNDTLNVTELESMSPAYNSTGESDGTGVYNITFDPGHVAQYLYITLSTPGVSLTLCEVRVFGGKR